MSRNRKKRVTNSQIKPVITKPTNPPEPKNGHIVAYGAKVQFSGPLPPPELLGQYNAIIPNGAERIMEMAEKQHSHRISLESFVIAQDFKRANLGLILAFVIALVTLIGSFWLLWLGKTLYGLGLIIVELITLVGIFLHTENVRKEERNFQRRTNTEKSIQENKIGRR